MVKVDQKQMTEDYIKSQKTFKRGSSRAIFCIGEKGSKKKENRKISAL
jgi:hypothetical protein